jgi:ABC-type branched-subunit amino acid transport system ATPase component
VQQADKGAVISTAEIITHAPERGDRTRSRWCPEAKVFPSLTVAENRRSPAGWCVGTAERFPTDQVTGCFPVLVRLADPAAHPGGQQMLAGMVPVGP